MDSLTLQSTPESGERASYDGGKRKRGSKVHIAVDALGHLLGLYVTSANEQDRAQVQELAQQVQQITAGAVEVAFVDSGYTGEQAAENAVPEGIHLKVVKLPEAKRGFVLLPRHWVVERSFAKNCSLSPSSTGLWRTGRDISWASHLVAFVILMLKRFVALKAQSA